jgi:hypothetical protein
MNKLSRGKEVQDRLQRLTDGFSGYNLGYVYEELCEIEDIVWRMIEFGEEEDERQGDIL